MQVQKISFTSENKQPQKEPSLYSKKGYMTLANVSRFEFGTAAAFGILEAFDKFNLIKNEKNLSKDALKKLGAKHTKINILIGLGAGVLSVLIGKLFDKKLMPWNERMYEKAEKLERINQKAKEIVEAEDAQKAQKQA